MYSAFFSPFLPLFGGSDGAVYPGRGPFFSRVSTATSTVFFLGVAGSATRWQMACEREVEFGGENMEIYGRWKFALRWSSLGLGGLNFDGLN